MLLRRSLAAAVVVCLLLAGTGIGLTTAAPAPSTVRVSYLQRILSLDPHGSAGAERMSWIIGRHLYNQLVSWDYSTKQFQPQLALRWRNIDPTTHRLFVVAAKFGPAPAGGRGRAPVIGGTFSVLVIERSPR